MNAKELAILAQFRKNARENLTTASRHIRVPISTIYDRLRRYEGTIIRRHTSLLDFAQLGYGIKVQMAIKVHNAEREAVLQFLTKHPRVNSLFTVSNEYNFMFEVILKTLHEVSEFNVALDSFTIIKKQEFYLVDDIKREEFMTDPLSVDMPISFVQQQSQ